MLHSASYETPDSQSKSVHAELHHDGTVAFAIALDGWFGPTDTDQHDVFSPLVGSFAVDFVALAETYARLVGAQSYFTFRFALGRADESKPYGAIDRWRASGFAGSSMEPIVGSRRVRHVIPAAGEVPVAADADVLKGVARTAAADILNQFGVADLLILG